MISKASKDESLPVYGEEQNVRDWLYAKDHCYGILAVIEKGRVGEVYNLCGHNERNNLYIVKRILSELGKPETLIIHVADRHGHNQRYAIDPAKANAELSWNPTTTFEDGIKLTIDWYKENQWWLDVCNKRNQEWLSMNYTDRKLGGVRR